MNDCVIERETTFTYLGIVMKNCLGCTDHIEFVRKKVNQRLDVLRRINHFLPFYTRNLFVSTMVLPFLDYCDIVWGDRNNKVLMDSLQVLQNRAAKIVFDRPVYSSSTQALWILNGKIFVLDGAYIDLFLFSNA